MENVMTKETLCNHHLEISSFNGEGYLPIIDFENWRVAELRYCEELEVDNLKDMQKHDESDEVFVLLEGDFTLFLGGQGDSIGKIEAVKLEPLKLYNVKKGTFHTHTPEKNATVLIVENRNTCDDNSPKVKLTQEQKNKIDELYKRINL
jgi:mannose-6-phosphate isomerase-like protein (cupin superfamily)